MYLWISLISLNKQKAVMIKGLKLLSSILGISILATFVVFFVLGVDGTSSLLGFDISDISIERNGRVYAFSLVEKLPILLFVASMFFSFFFLIALRTASFTNGLKKAFVFVKSYVKETFILVKASNVKFFLLIPFVASTYMAMYFPLTLDEPQTYYEFIKPPFWEALALYPYPNNHVLSSVISNITNEIPGLDLLFKIRIPVLIISLLTWVFAYRFMRKYYSESLALFVVAIGSVVATNLQHAYIARGYAYVMFFVVIGVYAAFNIVKNGNRKRDWLAFVLSSVFGAWTMPSYLYPFLSISIFIFIYNYKRVKTQILYSALVGVLVLILYSPILVVTGLDGLTSNEFVATIDRLIVIKSIPGFMLGTIVHIFYFPFYVLLAVFTLVLLFTIVKRDRNTLILWAVFGLTPCLFLIIHSVIPFFRTFFYYGFLFVFMIGVSFKDEIKKISPKVLFGVLMIAHLAMLSHFFYVSRDLMSDVFISDDFRKEILEDGKTYYFHSGISYLETVNANFEIERQKLDIKIFNGDESNIAKLPKFDYFVIVKKADNTSDFTPSKEINSVFSVPVNIYKWEDITSK